MEVHAQVLGDDGGYWPNADELAAVNERVMEELIELGATDPFVYSELAKAWVEFSVTVEADTELQAMEKGFGLIRAAIHAAGQATPGWERLLRGLTTSAKQLQPA